MHHRQLVRQLALLGRCTVHPSAHGYQEGEACSEIQQLCMPCSQQHARIISKRLGVWDGGGSYDSRVAELAVEAAHRPAAHGLQCLSTYPLSPPQPLTETRGDRLRPSSPAHRPRHRRTSWRTLQPRMHPNPYLPRFPSTLSLRDSSVSASGVWTVKCEPRETHARARARARRNTGIGQCELDDNQLPQTHIMRSLPAILLAQLLLLVPLLCSVSATCSS